MPLPPRPLPAGLDPPGSPHRRGRSVHRTPARRLRLRVWRECPLPPRGSPARTNLPGRNSRSAGRVACPVVHCGPRHRRTGHRGTGRRGTSGQGGASPSAYACPFRYDIEMYSALAASAPPPARIARASAGQTVGARRTRPGSARRAPDEAQPVRAARGRPCSVQIALRASTSASMSASLCSGEGVIRSRSVPFGTVG